MSRPVDDWKPETMPAMLIATAARLFARRIEERMRPVGVSVSQFPVFAALKDGARLSQKELAALANVEQPSMAQLLSRMERQGLVRRETDPADRRSALVSLTDEARARITPARAILAQGNEEALADMDSAQIDTFIGLLRHFIRNLEES